LEKAQEKRLRLENELLRARITESQELRREKERASDRARRIQDQVDEDRHRGGAGLKKQRPRHSRSRSRDRPSGPRVYDTSRDRDRRDNRRDDRRDYRRDDRRDGLPPPYDQGGRDRPAGPRGQDASKGRGRGAAPRGESKGKGKGDGKGKHQPPPPPKPKAVPPAPRSTNPLPKAAVKEEPRSPMERSERDDDDGEDGVEYERSTSESGYSTDTRERRRVRKEQIRIDQQVKKEQGHGRFVLRSRTEEARVLERARRDREKEEARALERARRDREQAEAERNTTQAQVEEWIDNPYYNDDMWCPWYWSGEAKEDCYRREYTTEDLLNCAPLDQTHGMCDYLVAKMKYSTKNPDEWGPDTMRGMYLWCNWCSKWAQAAHIQANAHRYEQDVWTVDEDGRQIAGKVRYRYAKP